MSYLVQSTLARDPHIIDRVTACAAGEGVTDPQRWAFDHQWVLSAEPGWVAAYASATVAYEDDAGVGPPGANEAAITDGMVLAAVQRALAD